MAQQLPPIPPRSRSKSQTFNVNVNVNIFITDKPTQSTQSDPLLVAFAEPHRPWPDQNSQPRARRDSEARRDSHKQNKPIIREKYANQTPSVPSLEFFIKAGLCQYCGRKHLPKPCSFFQGFFEGKTCYYCIKSHNKEGRFMWFIKSPEVCHNGRGCKHRPKSHPCPFAPKLRETLAEINPVQKN